MKPATKFIHAGVHPDPSTGAIMTPIYQTSTFVQEGPGKHKGYEYARTQNPTRTQLQDALAAAENGKYGISFGSGLAATDTLLKLFKPGDEIICTNDLYGGTYRLMKKIWEPFGLKFHFIDMSNADNITAALTPATKMIWLETPTNPLMRIIDISACAEIAGNANAMLAVDNTFASPFLQNPLDLGADVVMHSATKYIGGHSDVVHGCLITNNKEVADQLYFLQNACGAVPGPQDCFLLLRGLKTLHVRMQRHCENGEKIAHFLRQHPKVAKVHWCGFQDHPNHHIAKTQMKDFGGMMSFELKDDTVTAANKVLSSTHIFACAESLGGVESLIGHPASMTHASIPREERIANGLTDSLIRLSVGIEDAEDLIGDLNQALG
ncbi:MAG: cystathionine gamma-synthase [Bacteroidetes bacterium]|nr:cystathionine gamma-synthase [Bacteroidota bacterium]